MTAPVQMTHSSTSALVEPRGLRRSADLTADLSEDAAPHASSFRTQSSKAQSLKAKSKDVSDTDESSCSDDSANSLEDGDSTGQSSFGAILQKYVATSRSGGRASQSSQTDTSQQKKDSVEADPLATLADQPMGKHREVLPLRLSMLSPDTSAATPDTDSTSTPLNSSHAGPMSAVPAHVVLEVAGLPSGLLSLPQPSVPQAARPNQDARDNQTELSQATTSQAVTVQASPAQTLPIEAAPPQAASQAPQAPIAPEPEALAFAARLTPSTTAPGDEANTKAGETSSARPQTTSQINQRELPAPDSTASSAQPADSAADRIAMINTMPHLAHAETHGEQVSMSAKSDTRPVFTPAPARAEPVANPPAAPSSSSRDFTVRIPDATDRGTNVRFVERGSEVHVSVRTSDSELAQLLRGGLGDLTGRLQHSGVQAEVWRPGSDASHSDSQSQSSESKDQGGRRNQSGAQRDGQDQPNEDKPRWVEELESFGEPVGR
jgi:hypothetical protein